MEPTILPTHVPLAAAPEPPSAGEPSIVDGHQEHHDPLVHRGDLVRIGLVAVAVAMSWLFPCQPFLKINAAALTATLVGGYPIYKEASLATSRFRKQVTTWSLTMPTACMCA